jgi:predicted MPP superfamily phosphohydrolase
MEKKKVKLLSIFVGILLVIFAFCFWQNNDILTTNITHINKKIPDSFNGYKILQVSDLHSKEFGENNKNLIKKIKDAKPDVIVITGDLIDKHEKIKEGIVFASEAIKIAPVYFVSGNHEKQSGNYDSLKEQLIDKKVNVLENQKMQIEKDDEQIAIVGIKDILFYPRPTDGSPYYQRYENKLLLLLEEKDVFTVVLSHRPNLMKIYKKCGVELVLTGHAHGGQVRLPFIGGLYSPGQGIFPKYTKGEYKEDNTTMVVSRGLGNSIFPFRIFNRPEIVNITLSNK